MSKRKRALNTRIELLPDIEIGYFFSRGRKDTSLVFIHGLGSSKEDSWFMFEDKYLQEYTLLALDLVGHGESTTPLTFSYRMDDQAMIINELLNKRGITENVVLIAHSMGGPIAVALAERMGKKVTGLIYAEGNLDIGDCTFSKLITDSYTFDEWEKKEFNHFLTNLKEEWKEEEYAKSFILAGPKTTYYSAKELVEVSEKDNLLKRIEQLEIPVQAIFGEKNKGLFTSEKKLAEKFPISYIPKAGHGMMIDNPEAFTKAIKDFLVKHSFH